MIMMATAANFSRAPLLDLSFLTAEEKAKLKAVIKADQNLLLRDRVRVGTLRQELEKERYFQKQLLGKSQCTCCERRLVVIFNPGAPCPGCLYQVCKQCRVLSHKPPPPFLCPVCVKKRLVDIQAADYASVPSDNFSPSPLFGSQLLTMSLEATRTGGRTMVNPYNGKGRKSLLPSLTEGRPWSRTNDSAIYEEMERSESVLSGSGRSEDGSENGRRERPNSLPARKVSPTELSDSDEEEYRGLEVPGVNRMRNSESISSIGSLTSMYSAAGGKGDYAISGEIHFGVWYSRDGLLKVHIDQARNLAATRKEGYSYPYVKIYLLPDRTKQTKRKTGFVRRTVCPKYDETLKYKLAESELQSRTVWLSVWDWDRFGRNQFLGEVKLPLKDLNLTDATDHWHTLLDQDESAQLEAEGQYRGRLKLGLMFELDDEIVVPHLQEKRKAKKKKGVLHVAIKQAEDLPKMDSIALTNAVVKCYLLPSRTSSNKRKTQVVMNSIAPVWNEEFIYKCSLKELVGSRVLEVTIWDYDKRGSNDFIGGLRIGPTPSGSPQNKKWMDSIGEEAAHWEAVLARPGEWVEQWHTLRPRMDHMTTLPQNPNAFIRELSPVHEKLSPPAEEEEEQERKNEASHRASSLSSVRTSDGVLSTSSRSMSAPSKASSRPTTHAKSRDLPHALQKTQQSHPKSKQKPPLDTLHSRSHSPSPIPELVVTPDTTEIRHSTSSSSIHSTYSDGETGQGDYEITGEVQVGFIYRGGQLLIHINRAQGLAAADSDGFSDPYIKTFLLPDRSKHSKRKTGVQRKTLNPIFGETLEYSVAESELQSRTVWLSVWDWDRFGRNQFLGEIRLPLKSLDLRSEAEQWYSLVDKDQPYLLNPNSGQIQLALKFVPKDTEGGVTHGTFSVQIKRGCNLSTGETGKPDPCVECRLLPDTSASAKRKTAVVKSSSSPSWKESFLFDKTTLEEIVAERVLEVTVWDFNQGNSKQFIGGLRIGPTPSGTSQNKEWMDSSQEEAAHWKAMLAHPGEWAQQWHTLRRSMGPRKVASTPLQSNNTANSLDDEFRKAVAKSTTSSPLDSPVLSVRSRTRTPSQPASSSADELEQSSPRQRSSPVLSRAPLKHTLSQKPVENRFADLDSHSASPLVSMQSHSSKIPLAEISKLHDPLLSIPDSPEMSLPQDTGNLEGNQIPLSGPLKRVGLLGAKHGGSLSSFGSQLSIYSSAGGGRGNYEISGEVLVGISYCRGQLSVHVNKAQGLAAADSNGFSDPYIKTYLLPDHSKHSKRKTDIQRKTLDPVYNQTLIYKLAESELQSRTVWLSVWDWDRFGRNQFLGEVKLPLKDLDLTDATDYWHPLLDKDEDPEGMDFYRGQINLALRYSPTDTKKGKTRGSLQILIKQGRDFPSMGGNEKPDPVVKCYLLPDKSSSGKQKVGVIKNQNNPVWEEQLSYEKVVLEDIVKERVLEVTVWDWDKKGSSFIGGLRIGPTPSGTSQNKEWMDSIGEEATHWEAMLARPGQWVEQWHTLRTTMDPRNIAFQ